MEIVQCVLILVFMEVILLLYENYILNVHKSQVLILVFMEVILLPFKDIINCLAIFLFLWKLFFYLPLHLYIL